MYYIVIMLCRLKNGWTLLFLRHGSNIRTPPLVVTLSRLFPSPLLLPLPKNNQRNNTESKEKERQSLPWLGLARFPGHRGFTIEKLQRTVH